MLQVWTRRPYREWFFLVVVPCSSNRSIHSRATALMLLPLEAEVAVAEDPSVTAVARSATLRAPAPKLAVLAAAAEEEAAAMEEALEEEAKRPGRISRLSPGCRLLMVLSYTCGGVGHLSRDCVQGSKCYNCSGVVSCDYPLIWD
jgi:hypothetical protein